MLEKLFQVAQRQSTARTEIGGGVTTFMTMAYIIFVNPAILSQTGMDFGAVMVATCLSAALATLVMGLLANYPIALAPGMGENFFFLTAVLSMGITWQQGLAAVLISGIAFIILNLLKIRQLIIDAVPDTLKYGISAGIGLFIVFIGLVNGGVVERHPQSPVVPVQLGDLANPAVHVTLLGLALTAALLVRRVRGAILLGILGSGILGLLLGVAEYQGLVARPPSLAPTFLQMDLGSLLSWELVPIALIFLYMAIFDAIGTLIGVGEQAGLLRQGRLVRGTRALMADASGTVMGACLGTSTVTAYIESSAGVAAGARTGLANIVTGLLFIAAIFFSPLVRMIGGGFAWREGVFLYPITAPALIVVGTFMAANLRRIPWDDFSEAIPGLLVVTGIPLTYSIADGLALGFVSYPVVKLLGGRGREVGWLGYLLGSLFVARYLFL
ncbi:MAG: NCS2 family permease [Candidatus Eisenbacteria bacterium]|nr:NCS2 family permease [Candidatus Eisenbacteria bacterium]